MEPLTERPAPAPTDSDGQRAQGLTSVKRPRSPKAALLEASPVPEQEEDQAGLPGLRVDLELASLVEELGLLTGRSFSKKWKDTTEKS